MAALRLYEPSPLRGVVSCEQSRVVDAQLSPGCENTLAVGPGVHVHQLNGMRVYSDLVMQGQNLVQKETFSLPSDLNVLLQVVGSSHVIKSCLDTETEVCCMSRS